MSKSMKMFQIGMLTAKTTYVQPEEQKSLDEEDECFRINEPIEEIDSEKEDEDSILSFIKSESEGDGREKRTRGLGQN